jgi:hypothetical protein
MSKWLTGEWLVEQTTASRRRIAHYWATVVWVTIGLVVWIILRDALWFVGFMSLYAIWVSHIAGWAAETPVEPESDVGEPESDAGTASEGPAGASALAEAEPH